jgi:predicted nucleotidyltransferase
MINVFNPDFVDFIDPLNKAEVRYILIGGYAVILHGYNRTTGDLDVWVEKTRENHGKLMSAFDAFGFPRDAVKEEDFLLTSELDVFTFGKPPVSIDILTAVKGLEFNQAYLASQIVNMQKISVRVIDLNSLVVNKRSVGRHKDMDDIRHLTEEE